MSGSSEHTLLDIRSMSSSPFVHLPSKSSKGKEKQGRTSKSKQKQIKASKSNGQQTTVRKHMH